METTYHYSHPSVELELRASARVCTDMKQNKSRDASDQIGAGRGPKPTHHTQNRSPECATRLPSSRI